MNNLVLKHVPDSLVRQLELAAEGNNQSIDEEIVARLKQSFEDHDDTEPDDVQRILQRVAHIRNQFSGTAATES